MSTALRDELQRRGVTRLAVTGLVSPGCVCATCLDSVQKGYQLVLGRRPFRTRPRG
ncbi:MAG: isochorismatase family protein [Anaerolineae bacterium]